MRFLDFLLRSEPFEEKGPRSLGCRCIMGDGGARHFNTFLHSTSRPILTDAAAAAMTLHCSKTLIAGYDEKERGASYKKAWYGRTEIIMKTHAV